MIKKIIPWTVFAALFLFIIFGFAFKGKMNSYLSGQMKNNITPELNMLGNAYIDSAFNYTKSGLAYKITFLEIGAKGCSACKRMEAVMDDISNKFPDKVNVVFFNILKPESQNLMKYFGVTAIPTQIFLNNEGKEIFRHTGFFSTNEVTKNLIIYGVK